MQYRDTLPRFSLHFSLRLITLRGSVHLTVPLVISIVSERYDYEKRPDARLEPVRRDLPPTARRKLTMTDNTVRQILEEFDVAERLFAKHERHPDDDIFDCVADRRAAAHDVIWEIKAGRIKDPQLREMVYERQSLVLARCAAMFNVMPNLVVKRPGLCR
jgi:hypothetical protein